ncbi:MAG: radical SAM protein [Nannocystaceae bacterium]
MASHADERRRIRTRLSRERVIQPAREHAPVVLTYPSPYRVGMSSLGFLTLHRQLNAEGPGAHRAFLPDHWERQALAWPAHGGPLVSYESQRPISCYRVIALSVAYELEVVGVIRLLEGSGLPLLASERGPRDPIVVAGGPLTNSNASVLLPFVDLLVCGEGEDVLPAVLACVDAQPRRDEAIDTACRLPHVLRGAVPRGVHDIDLPELARVGSERLPAHAGIITPDTELSDMFLVEPERGCSRRCTFCVMRGETTGGMRMLDIEVPLGLVPDDAPKVGLVGAAVTDHPKLEELVARVVEEGRGIGISSLRADRLTPTLMANLARGGYRTITVASDGISESMRRNLHRKIEEQDLISAAQLVSAHNFHRLKVYEMIGAPGERDEDADELIRFVSELAKIARITLTFSTFVAKRNTPLDGAPFLGIQAAQQRLARIRAGLGGRVELRPQPPKWAYVEYELAQRGPEAGYAAMDAVHAGGTFADWKRSLAALGPNKRTICYGDEQATGRRKGRAAAPIRIRVDSHDASG